MRADAPVRSSLAFKSVKISTARGAVWLLVMLRVTPSEVGVRAATDAPELFMGCHGPNQNAPAALLESARAIREGVVLRAQLCSTIAALSFGIRPM